MTEKVERNRAAVGALNASGQKKASAVVAWDFETVAQYNTSENSRQHRMMPYLCTLYGSINLNVVYPRRDHHTGVTQIVSEKLDL